jgi:hypothetical protein
MAAEKEPAGNHFSQGGESILQTCAVAGGVARTGRAEGPRLAIRKIAAQHGKAMGTESLG